jgi:hypothetical protein
MNGEMPTEAVTLSDDLLKGAAEIARFVFGSDDERARRKVYHLCESQRPDGLPVFKLGNQICARKSTILKAIAEREQPE